MDEQVTPADKEPATKRGGFDWSRNYWWTWISASLVSWAIWLAVFLTDEHHKTDGFWPIWVTLPLGAVLLANAGRPKRK